MFTGIIQAIGKVQSQTPRGGDIRLTLDAGKLVIFDIDVQGHRLARNRMGDWITSAFITPPSLAELERRLRSRSTESDAAIAQRLHNAREEIQAIDEFDYVIINDDMDAATESFVALAQTARLKPGKDERRSLVKQWLTAPL